MTEEEEVNMWARLVKLEEQVGYLIDAVIKLAGEQLPNEPRDPGTGGIGSMVEPVRDRYGDFVGRPEM